MKKQDGGGRIGLLPRLEDSLSADLGAELAGTFVNLQERTIQHLRGGVPGGVNRRTLHGVGKKL
jgi:hypothetical protein